MTWALSVPLLPEESLSSWLVRAALRQGCDPLSLTGAIWPTWRIWTRDIDREIPLARMRPLVNASGISSAKFQKAGMRDDCEKVVGYSLPETRTWPWLLALGSRNRTRHGGQQVCTLCLAEDSTPYLRRHWRFAWHTGCRFHGVQLVDECPACKAPIEPHRLTAEGGPADGHPARSRASPPSTPNRTSPAHAYCRGARRRPPWPRPVDRLRPAISQ